MSSRFRLATAAPAGIGSKERTKKDGRANYFLSSRSESFLPGVARSFFWPPLRMSKVTSSYFVSISYLRSSTISIFRKIPLRYFPDPFHPPSRSIPETTILPKTHHRRGTRDQGKRCERLAHDRSTDRESFRVIRQTRSKLRNKLSGAASRKAANPNQGQPTNWKAATKEWLVTVDID